QPRLDVLRTERFAQQRVLVEIDLPDGQVVGRAPVGVQPPQQPGIELIVHGPSSGTGGNAEVKMHKGRDILSRCARSRSIPVVLRSSLRFTTSAPVTPRHCCTASGTPSRSPTRTAYSHSSRSGSSRRRRWLRIASCTAAR